tara:strand:- start:835 stop:1464 length:630 start_codon:yes stop_codon:yes gene_type:complete
MLVNILGIGNYTEVIIELCLEVGYTDIKLFHFQEDRNDEYIMGYKIEGSYDTLLKSKSNSCVVVGIGDNKTRGLLLNKFRDSGFKTPSLIHPDSYISKSAIIGEAVYIHSKAFVWTKVSIGNNSIVSPNAMISHHTKVGENCLISANSMVGSYNTLGENVLFGINSSSLSKKEIEIGDNVIIGANSLVTKRISSNSKVLGSPAKKIVYE